MINGLIMDSRRKDALKALAKSFARRNRHGEELGRSMWSADFVRGKGSGLIFLLHGAPGVGKTCTAGKYARIRLVTSSRILLPLATSFEAFRFQNR